MPKLVHGTAPDREPNVRLRCRVAGCTWDSKAWLGTLGVTQAIADREYAKHYLQDHDATPQGEHQP